MGVQLIGPINTGVGSGGAGVATSSKTSSTVVRGRVLGTYIKYNDSPPETTDVTIATAGAASGAPPANTILTISDANTSGWFYPRHKVHDEAGAGVTFDGTNEIYEPVPIHDQIKVTIAQADDGDNADVWLLVED